MIKGKHVSLGPILPADFPSLFRWSDDLEAAALNEAYRPVVWKSAEEFWFGAGRDPSRVHFSIRKLDSLTIIGFVQISCIDAVHRAAMLGVRIGDETDRGKGFGREATQLAIEYCWDHLNLSRIALGVFASNERAIAVYRSVGFEEEGRLRQAVFIAGQWVDMVLMAQLHPSRQNPLSQ